MINANMVINFTDRPIYSVVGSVLQWARFKRTHIWGSGFLQGGQGFRTAPERIHAVRGPLSREVCLRQGVACPPIYGDPAVFVFKAITGIKRTEEFKLGVIPHYVDAPDPRIDRLRRIDSVLVIDVMRPIAEVVSAVSRCRAVVSSSLHGLILADCLSIPSRWIKLSTPATRDGFKFLDYFKSIGRNEDRPLELTDSTDVRRLLSEVRGHRMNLDLDLLLEACPFRHDSITGVDSVPVLAVQHI